MKPEDLSPSQMLSLMALGMVMLSLLVGATASWSYAIAYFRAQRKFSSARGPLATFGLVDIALGIALLFSMMIVVSLVSFLVLPKNEEVIALPIRDADSIVFLDENGSNPKGDSKADVASKEESSQSKSGEKPWGEISSSKVILSGVFASGELIAVFIVAMFVMARTGLGLSSMGWHPRQAGRDIGIGLLILLMTLPLLLIVSALVSKISGVAYNHPVIEMMQQFPWLLGVVAWQAVIVAPIAEEFFFRSVLIGWFESIHFGKSRNAFVAGWNPITRQACSSLLSASIDDGGMTPKVRQSEFQKRADPPENLYSAAIAIDNLSPTNSRGETQEDQFHPPWWPAIVSGVLFGLAHISYGLSWIPLALFGIVLGRVYQHRQSLIMCITIHMVFNAINLFNLWLSLGLPQPK